MSDTQKLLDDARTMIGQFHGWQADAQPELIKYAIMIGKLRAALEQATKPPERLAAMPGPVPHDREGAYIRGLNDAVAIITAEVRNVVRAVESERSQAAHRPAQDASE